MKIEIHRSVAEWHNEIWHVEIPDGTPEDEIRDAAIDAMDDMPELVHDDPGGLVETIDADYTTIQPVSA